MAEWTKEEDAILLKRYEQGEEPKNIAKELGRTKNGVLGRIHRLRKAKAAGEVPHSIVQPHMKEKFHRIRFKKHKIPVKAHPLVKQLFHYMNTQQCSIEKICSAVNMSKVTMQTWKWTASPSLPLLIACYNYLGYDLRPVKMKDEDAED